MTKNLSVDRLAAARHVVSRMLGLKPGHAGEAIAAALGFNTHAALRAARGAGKALPARPDAQRFRARLAGLGHDRAGTEADEALAAAFGCVPIGAIDQASLATLVDVAACIDEARARIVLDNPGFRDMVLALYPVPGGSPALTVGRDTVRWNKDLVRYLDMDELRFLLAGTALHRAAAHPLRKGDRDGVLWSVACDYVVNHYLLENRLGRPPVGIYADDRFTADMTAEAVYERIAAETRRFPPCLYLNFETWRAQAPSVPRSIVEIAEGALARKPFADDFCSHEMPGFSMLRSGGVTIQALVADKDRRRSRGVEAGAGAKGFGRDLARQTAGLPPLERSRAVADALEEVRSSYDTALVEGIVGTLGPSPRS